MHVRPIVGTAVVVLALTAAACSRTSSVDLPSPAPLESSNPTPSTSVVTPVSPGAGRSTVPEPTANTPTPTAVPTDPPPVKQGQGRFIVKGSTIGADLTFSDVEGYPIYSPPKAVSINWQDENGSLTIGGDNLKEGTSKTSTTLAINFAIRAGNHAFSAGEKGCLVTIDKMTKKIFAGSFTCPKAIDITTNEPVKVIASFEYKP